MTNYVDDILAGILEKRIAKTKLDFAKDRDAIIDRINKVLVALKTVLDKVANEETLREARVLALRVPVTSLFGEGSKPVIEGIMAYLGEVSKETASKRTKPMSREEVIEMFELSPKAVAAFDKGATIGELLVIQPDLLYFS